MWCLSALVFLLPVVRAAQAPVFKQPSPGPLIPSANLGGPSNGSLPKPTVVPGKAFDRFVQIWLENTDYEVAASSPTFAKLAQQGITLSQYYGLTHPSEPNYVASVGGDYFGMGDDDFYNIDANISTIVDLLEAKNISWASYQESMSTDGSGNFEEQQPNYLNSSAPLFTYYVRKHNPLIIYDSVASVPARAARQRNFNDFGADVNASAIPQWLFVTPNMINDGHETTIDFIGKWLEFWLIPLLSDKRFNDDRTLISLTFDENDNHAVNNRVINLLLGGAVPKELHGTTDSTYYSHYSSLSTVESNWGLGCLGRGDTNKTMANVYSFVANVTGYQNVNVTGSAIPLTNLSMVSPGPLNPDLYIPYPAPNTNAVCPGGGSVFVAPTFDLKSVTTAAPVNVTAMNKTVPDSGPFKPSSLSPGGGSGAPGSETSNGARREAMSVGVAALGAMLVVAELCI